MKNFVVKYINGDLNPEIDFFENEGVYHSFKKEGVELFFYQEDDCNELKYIFFHLNNLEDEYDLYKKELPFGLHIEDKKDGIIDKLGSPTKEVKAIPLIGKNCSHIFEKGEYKIIVEYSIDNNKVKTISIQI